MALFLLMGLKHSGKSTLGRMLAQKLGWEFRDLDDEACAQDPERRDLSPREIYRVLGKQTFSGWEAQAARRISSKDKLVVALGGGTVDNKEAMGALDAAPRRAWVWLDEETSVLFERIAAGGIPPFLDPERPRASFEELAARRSAAAAAWNPVVVNERGKSLDEVLETLLEIWEEHFGG